MNLGNRKVYKSQSMKNIGLKGQPWLHVVVLNGSQQHKKLCVSFIWDTREIVESKEYDVSEYSHTSWIIANDNKRALRDTNKLLPPGLANKEPKQHGIKVPIEFKNNGPGTREAYINGKLICVTKKGQDLYCKIVKGVPSNLRSVPKPAKSTAWYTPALIKALIEVTGNKPNIKLIVELCKDHDPDTNYGYTGLALSDAAIIRIVNQIANSK